MRLGAVVIAVCMVVVALSAGAIAYSYLGANASEAATLAVATLAALALYNAASARIGLRTAVGHQLADLSRAEDDLARQVAELGRRVAAVESKVEAGLDRARAVTDPLTMEIAELGNLVKQLAETVAAHQDALAARSHPSVPTATPAADAMAQKLVEAPALAAARHTPSPEAANADVMLDSPDAVLASVRAAITDDRIDVYLQPIVTLPQRKVRYYEALSRLRTESGGVMHATDFLAQAEHGGLMPTIDRLVIFRCVQVVRRLLLKNRDIGLFCNLSLTTLKDSESFERFLEFMDANRAIASSLVLELTQDALRTMGPIEHERLAALSERGFRYSMDNVADLRIEPRQLADRGFRFVKVHAGVLLERTVTASSDIRPAELSELLEPFGIDLIADKIENEGSVVDLLDCDVRYGQGFLFSPPRPMRPEALRGIAERSDPAAEAPDQAAPADNAEQRMQPGLPETGKTERAPVPWGVLGRGG